MKIIFSFFIIILFLGCSDKINLDSYRPFYVPKNKAAPKNLKPRIKKVSILKFPPYRYKNIRLNTTATYELNSLLQNSRFVKVLRIISPEKIKDEIKASELSLETDSPLGADYIIKGKILNASYTPYYHQGYYYYIKTKHGKKLKYSPPYYSYKACVQININVLKLPGLNPSFSKNFTGCSYYADNTSYRKFYPDLIINSVNKASKNAYGSLKRFFAPKGYIYEVKSDGDDLIAKITLGYSQGMSENLKLNIYKLIKDPVTGDIEKYLIGTGKVSNIIFNNSSWITVKLNKNQKLQIGDMVIPDFNTSFWDLF